VDFGSLLVLGLIAGGTILIGLLIARVPTRSPGTRTMFAAISVGVLLFLLWDVLAHAWEPIDALLAAQDPLFIGYGLLFGGGIAAGLVGVAAIAHGVGTRRTEEISPRRLALIIAAAIGVHNLAEGLAIGQSAAGGELALAVALVIGFALHNATEGFGIVAPLAGEKPSWRFLLLLGAIGGGPTLLGTLLGSVFVSEPLSVLFLALSAGSITYVVIELLAVTAKAKRPVLVAVGTLAGLLLGFATDGILIAAGA
jgi:ZIP family zinc transporter